jgi:hypothetical protein
VETDPVAMILTNDDRLAVARSLRPDLTDLVVSGAAVTGTNKRKQTEVLQAMILEREFEKRAKPKS